MAAAVPARDTAFKKSRREKSAIRDPAPNKKECQCSVSAETILSPGSPAKMGPGGIL